MLKLIFTDLVANVRVWLGALLVAAATAAVGAVVGCGIETAVAVGGTDALALYGISGTILTFTLVTTLIVTGTVANLTVALQQRAYALWQLAGVGPGVVRTVVTSQLAVIALVGAVIGCVAALPALQPLLRIALAGVHPRFDAWGAVPVIVAVVLVMTLGGARSATRAGRTPPIRSLREPELPGLRMSPGRWAAGLATLATTVAIVASLPGTDPQRLVTPLSLVGPLTAGVFAAFGPLFLTPLLRGWTSLVPVTASSAWFLARNSTAQQVARSTAAISPIMVAIALAGGLYAADATVTGGDAPGAGSVALLLGGPLLLALLGAAATIFMSSGRREREYALILAAGGTPATVLGAAAAEAIIYVGTAGLLGATAVTVTALTGAWAAGANPAFGLGAVAAVAGASLALTLVATVVPTALALRRDVPRTLSADA
jgi:putative ABC transport system permease protein